MLFTTFGGASCDDDDFGCWLPPVASKPTHGKAAAARATVVAVGDDSEKELTFSAGSGLHLRQQHQQQQRLSTGSGRGYPVGGVGGSALVLFSSSLTFGVVS